MDGSVTMDRLDFWKRKFREAEDVSQTERIAAVRARRYYDGKIDPTLHDKLKRSRQPDFMINRVRPGIEGMVGVVERGKTDPRAYPRTPDDENASEVATDVLRFVADVNRWHVTKIASFRNMLIEGTAACLVEVDAKLDVKIRRIRYEEFFADPFSREADFSDARYMGVAKWQDEQDVVAVYPEYADAIKNAINVGESNGANQFADRPTTTTWTDSARRRMLVVECYAKSGGEWLKGVFCGGVVLEEGPSPYQDDDGKPCNPIEAVSAYVDDENRRYGAVRDMEGPSDEINTYRRKGAHYATFRQLQETDPTSAGADPEEARKEAAKPDGVIPSGWGVVPNTDKFSMDMALLAEAKAEIERASVNPAILGRQGESQSGRASLIRQQAGLTELAHLYGSLEDFELRIYRQIWSRVRQFWTAPKFIRVTDEEKAAQFIQINEPIYGEPMPVIDEITGFPKFDPYTRQIVMAPQVIGYENSVAEMGVDIIVDSTPDTANVQQEQFQQMVELAKVGGLGPNPGPLLLKASNLPKKRELVEELEKASAQPNPMQQQAAQLEMREKEATVGKTEAQAQKEAAQAMKTFGEAQANAMAFEAQAAFLNRPVI